MNPRPAAQRGADTRRAASVSRDNQRPVPAAIAGVSSSAVPDLGSYDRVVVSISGGKDSQAALHRTVVAAEAAGVLDRVVTVFADLGPDDEWPGTAELAAEHAAFYGLAHEVVCREVTAPDGRRVRKTLTEHIEARGLWPDAARRYCTSDMKRAPVHRLLTRIAAEHRAARPGRKVRILSVLGMRAEESRSRALLAPFGHDARASNQTVRHVDRWLPVHELTTAQVWDVIGQAGTRAHWVYAYLPRLSCRFCVLASRPALIRAAILDPEGAVRRAGQEQRMGHQFRPGLSMAEIVAASRDRTIAMAPPVTSWAG
jgi:3'-phosphoadenosine 5'-phosphosulfate sulfotransferase (PAPS reductase)/FAD synthetase